MSTTTNSPTLDAHIQAEVWTPLSEAARYLREGNEIIGQAVTNEYGVAHGLALTVANLAKAHPESPELAACVRQLEQARIKYFATAKRVRLGRDGMRGLFGIPERTPTPPRAGAGLSENVTKSAPESWGPRETRATTPDVMAAIARMSPAERLNFEQTMAEWKNGAGVAGEQLPPQNPPQDPKLYDAALDVPGAVKAVSAEAPKGASSRFGRGEGSLGQGMVDDVPVSTVKCANCDKDFLPHEIATVKVGDTEFAICGPCENLVGGLKVAA